MDNPFLAPVDLSTGQLITTPSADSQFTAPYSIPAGTAAGGGFLGADGFLSKAAETAVDLFGLYGQYELQKDQLESTGSDNRDPVIVESQNRAGILPSAENFPVKELLIGGGVVLGFSILTIGAIAMFKN